LLLSHNGSRNGLESKASLKNEWRDDKDFLSESHERLQTSLNTKAADLRCLQLHGAVPRADWLPSEIKPDVKKVS
jgi:hypothetical protein